jgi:hypothetical protein
LYKTTNGVFNWSQLNTPSVTVENMHILNQDTIWFVWSNTFAGGVFFTANGGGSWEQRGTFGSQNPEKIYMYNARIGFISKNMGSSGYVRKTTNGGASWDLIVNNDYYLDIYFADSLTGWKSSAFGFKKTTNGGLNWVAQTLPGGGMIQTNPGLSFSNINKDTIWSSGGYLLYPNNQTHGFLNRTTNGGGTWLFQIPDTSLLYVGGFVNFVNKLNGWATSTYGGIHTTTGGGDTFYTPIKQISSKTPKDFKLYQNYPNPFNPKTHIIYELSVTSFVILSVFDVTGKKAVDLVNQKQSAGSYEVTFDGTAYSSGIYFYSLFIDNKLMETKRMILLK